MDQLEGDRGRTILAMIIARAWKDKGFKEALLKDPKAALKKEGIEVPADVNLKIVEDKPPIKYFNLSSGAHSPEEPLSAMMTKASRLLSRVLPIPEGAELRLVQSTPKTRYIIFPQPPPTIKPAEMSESELMAMAADSGTEATYHDTTQSVEAETTEVTVTETSEVQDVETSTTVVAEAELVAT